MTRRIIFALISLVLLLLLSAIASPIAAGQEQSAFYPVVELPAPDDTSSGTSGSARHQQPRPASICDEEHWIISVRHCQQRCHRCAHECTFDFVRSDWNGCATQSSGAEFHSWLKPGVPVCIMIHGSFVTADTVTEDSRNTFQWLRKAAPHLPLQVVFLTWPSEGLLTLNPAIATSSAVPGLDVAILGRRAEFNGIRLVKLIQMIPPESPISLIGHSHGARIAVSGLNLMGGGELCGVRLCNGPSHRIRTILAAAAIDHDWLCPGERYDRALNATECLLNIQVRNDWALAIYPLRKPFSSRALGSTGFTRGDRRRFDGQAPHVANYDLSGLIGYGHIWPKYYEHSSVADALVPWVYFVEQ